MVDWQMQSDLQMLGLSTSMYVPGPHACRILRPHAEACHPRYGIRLGGRLDYSIGLATASSVGRRPYPTRADRYSTLLSLAWRASSSAAAPIASVDCRTTALAALATESMARADSDAKVKCEV